MILKIKYEDGSFRYTGNVADVSVDKDTFSYTHENGQPLGAEYRVGDASAGPGKTVVKVELITAAGWLLHVLPD